jgi:hypothetical protein
MDRENDACEYLIRLRPLAGAIPVAVRLRRGLKLLLRACGLRCLDVQVVEPQGDRAPASQPRAQVTARERGPPAK